MKFVSFNDWDELPESANALFAEGEKDSIFFSRAWFNNLVNTALEDDQTLLIACVIEGDRMLAILPIMKRSSEKWYSLRNIYTSLYSLLLADNDKQAILTCLAQGLGQLPLESLQLRPVAEDDKNINCLQRVMELNDFDCYRHFQFYNWIHRVQGKSFKDYMAARPSRLRNTIARKQRKLEREHGYSIRLFIDDDLQQALADYNAIYTASWKANEIFGGFIQGLLASMSEQGWLRLAILYIAGQPAAAQIWFVAHGKASIFKLAYDEAWKQYSAGSILTSYLMQYVIDTDKVEEIDFLTGNDAYKQDWMTERRQRWRLAFVNRREPEGRASQFVESLKGLLTRKKNRDES